MVKPDPKSIDLSPCIDGRMRIENPWVEIQTGGPFVLGIDRGSIEVPRPSVEVKAGLMANLMSMR